MIVFIALFTSATFTLPGPSLARTLDNNLLLNVRADFAHNVLGGTGNRRNLTRTLVHEMIHCLQAHRYGLSCLPSLAPSTAVKAGRLPGIYRLPGDGGVVGGVKPPCCRIWTSHRSFSLPETLSPINGDIAKRQRTIDPYMCVPPTSVPRFVVVNS